MRIVKLLVISSAAILMGAGAMAKAPENFQVGAYFGLFKCESKASNDQNITCGEVNSTGYAPVSIALASCKNASNGNLCFGNHTFNARADGIVVTGNIEILKFSDAKSVDYIGYTDVKGPSGKSIVMNEFPSHQVHDVTVLMGKMEHSANPNALYFPVMVIAPANMKSSRVPQMIVPMLQAKLQR